MVSQDWTAPPPSDPAAKPAPLHEWKVDVDERAHFTSGIAIYEVPTRTPGLDSHIRLVATCENRADADLIVGLYEAHRRAR